MIVSFNDVSIAQIVEMIKSESMDTFLYSRKEDDGAISILFHKDTVKATKDLLLEWEIVSYDATFPYYIAAANHINGHFEVMVKAK